MSEAPEARLYREIANVGGRTRRRASKLLAVFGHDEWTTEAAEQIETALRDAGIATSPALPDARPQANIALSLTESSAQEAVPPTTAPIEPEPVPSNAVEPSDARASEVQEEPVEEADTAPLEPHEETYESDEHAEEADTAPLEPYQAEGPEAEEADMGTPPAPSPAEEARTPVEGAAVRTRVCPQCSSLVETSGRYCPYCGAALERRSRRSRLRRRLGGLPRRAKVGLVAVGALLILGGAGTGVALKIKHDNDVEAEKERASEQARKRAEEQRRQDELQQNLNEIQLEGRRDLEQGLEKSVTKDARNKVASGLLDGPILRTSCTPVGGGREDVDQPTGKYECLAVTKENADGTSSGYSFDATIDYEKFSYTWQLGGP